LPIKDLKRLDRLISDISSSSRLEVELAKGEFDIIDIRDVLEVCNGSNKNKYY
jgi:two-component system sensor histidine kinase ChvG